MTPPPPIFTTFTRIREITHSYTNTLYTYYLHPLFGKSESQVSKVSTCPLRSLLLHQTLTVGLQTPAQFRKNSGTLFRPVLQDLQIDAENIVILMQVYTFALFTFM